MRFLLLSAPLLLTACAGSPPPITHVCPPRTAYTPAQEHQVAAEMRAAPQDAEWPRWIRDYIATRQAIRKCKG